MTDFVLVHGAFRGGWSFRRVQDVLEAAGHRSDAPTLPGDAELAPQNSPLPDLNVCARAVAERIKLADLREVVLVGHSQGGLVIQAVSQLVPEHLARLVFLDAPEPRHGERALDLQPPALAGTPIPDVPPEFVLPVREVSSGEHMSEADAAWINSRLTPAHAAMALTQLTLDDPRALALPRHHVFCRHTPEAFPCAHARARCDAEGVAYRWLETGHDAPVTHPQQVADVLMELAKG